MHSESFEEIFRYVGQAPELTPEEKRQREQKIKEMDRELAKDIQRLKIGIRSDGTKYEEDELKHFKAVFGDDESMDGIWLIDENG